jgi:TRAP-type C4-dicarboxylate transport system permease small subunit
MKKFLVVLDEACLKIAATLFFIIFVVSIVEIILRSFFGFSLLWTMDLCTLLASWTILLGAASTLHRADHLVVDFLVNKMDPRKRTIIRLCASILLLVFLVILIYNGVYVSILKMDIYYTSLRWPSGFAYIALPVFGLISSLFMVERIRGLVATLRRKGHESTGGQV